MAGGVFALDRGVFDHPVFAAEPFTEREAWVWLVGLAAWKPQQVKVGHAVIRVSRGQCALSTRFAATRWKWSEARVRRFLAKLAGEAMIESKADAHATQITICNYERYQKISQTGDADVNAERRTSDALSDAPLFEKSTQASSCEQTGISEQRRTSDALSDAPLFEKSTQRRIKNKEEKKDAAVPAALPSPVENPEKALFDRGVALLGKSAYGLVRNLLKAKSGNVALARAVVETASTKSDPRGYLIACTQRAEAEQADIIKPAKRARPYDPICGGYEGAPPPLKKGECQWAI